MAAATATATVSALATTLSITKIQITTIITGLYPSKKVQLGDYLSIDEVTAITYCAGVGSNY